MGFYFSLVFWYVFFSSSLLYPFAENEDDTLNNQVDQDSSTILNECKRDASKRRPSLAQKMTSNLRRLSGATELKIDINDSISANNSKYCNKKIKVGIQVYVCRGMCGACVCACLGLMCYKFGCKCCVYVCDGPFVRILEKGQKWRQKGKEKLNACILWKRLVYTEYWNCFAKNGRRSLETFCGNVIQWKQMVQVRSHANVRTQWRITLIIAWSGSAATAAITMMVSNNTHTHEHNH